jgi:serine/threonine protein phosphatase PrpC
MALDFHNFLQGKGFPLGPPESFCKTNEKLVAGSGCSAPPSPWAS